MIQVECGYSHASKVLRFIMNDSRRMPEKRPSSDEEEEGPNERSNVPTAVEIAARGSRGSKDSVESSASLPPSPILDKERLGRDAALLNADEIAPGSGTGLLFPQFVEAVVRIALGRYSAQVPKELYEEQERQERERRELIQQQVCVLYFR